MNLYIVLPVLSGQTHKLTPDQHSPAHQHSFENLWLHTFFARKHHSAVWDEWQHMQSAVSSICKSMLRFNLFTLSSVQLDCLNPKSTSEKMLFSHLTLFFKKQQRMRIWTIALTLSRNSTATRELIFLQQDSMRKLFCKRFCFIISVIVQCNFGFHGQIVQAGAFRDIWSKSKRDLFPLHRKATQFTPLFCL